MNASETVTLAEFVQKLCPSQLFDRDTWKTWLIVLADVPYADAQQATLDVYKTLGDDREWGARRIEPDDILRAVGRIRSERVKAHAPILPPAELADDPRAEAAWRREANRRIGNGETLTDTRGQLAARPVRRAIAAAAPKRVNDL